MEQIKSRNAINIILSVFFTAISFVLLFSGATSVYIINKTASSSILNSITSLQKMIVSNLSQDILSGGYSEVYRKCSNIALDPNILYIKVISSEGEKICDTTKHKDSAEFSKKISQIYFDKNKSEIAATIEISYTSKYAKSLIFDSFLILIISLILILCASIFLSKKIGKNIILNFKFLNKILKNYNPEKYIQRFKTRPKSGINEFNSLFNELHRLSLDSLKHRSNLVKATEIEAQLTISKQVAHDIRSPLAALDMIISETDKLPESHRSIIRNATGRIQDIANNLLAASRNEKSTSDILEVHMVSGLLGPIMTEKRTQFRKRIGIEIESDLSKSYGLFIKVNATEFKRVISNLINNAVEALGENGIVNITPSIQDHNAVILISDNGPGIPDDILSKLMKKGATFGKKGGSGLGLFHAQKSIKSWGGNLEIKSKVEVGTQLIISLPIASTPKWFLKSVNLKAGSEIIILDDDTTIHQVWKNKFSAFDFEKANIKIQHFTSPKKVYDWFKTRDLKKQYMYFFDYEILGLKITGLDIIEDLKIHETSTLVTSHYEEEDIRKRCLKINLPLLPKNLATYIPIVMDAPISVCDSVLIDDDELVRMTWKIKANKNNMKLLVFPSSEEFLIKSSKIQKHTPIYIDSDLGSGNKGEDLAIQLNNEGFNNLYLATGYEADHFDDLKFLKGIIGKEAPFPD